MSAKPKRYFVRKTKNATGSFTVLWTFDVIDRQTGKSVFNSMFESRATHHRNKLNKTETAYPGGFNKRTK